MRLLARFKAVRESQGLTLAEVDESMGIDSPALSRLETGKVLNPTLATLVLDKIPDELLSQLELLATRERLSVAENTVRLLREAVGQKAKANGSHVQEILDRPSGSTHGDEDHPKHSSEVS